jgi:hypothetical protein
VVWITLFAHPVLFQVILLHSPVCPTSV